MKNLHILQENIYITSDEEIKDGDWFLTDDKRVEKCAPDWRAREWHKKIILTTDQDLIIDGVQAIDDEFLQWFVKNPSCEFVKVEEFEPIYGHQNNSNSVLYKIIIPSVETKQDIEKEMFELEQELDILSSMRWHNSKPKQETLEEARKRISKDFSNGSFRYGVYHGVLEGAKWQQEQDKNKYSEVFEWLDNKDYLSDKVELIQKEFEQFKNK